MKFSHLLTLAIASSMFLASAAQAVVTVTHTSTATGTLTVGQSFSVDVVLGYDGTPTLTGVFVSAGWDPAQLSLTNTPTAPNFAIFIGPSGLLSKVADPSSFPGDTAGTIRTVQYGANPGSSASAGADVVITTLTFQVIGVGDGTADVNIVFNNGDTFLGAAGAPLAPGDRTLTNFSIAVPEPSSAVLAFSVLAALGLIHRVKMR
jgi:hypothetical protein